MVVVESYTQAYYFTAIQNRFIETSCPQKNIHKEFQKIDAASLVLES